MKFRPIQTKIAIACAVTGLVGTMATTPANAGSKGDLIAAGLIGLTIGAIATQHRQYRHQRANVIYNTVPTYRPPVTIYQPQPVVRYYQPRPQVVYQQPANVIYRQQPVQTQPRYHNSEPRVITYDQAMGQHKGYEPWTPQWNRWCANRYRSFNPRTGTFRGYDGADHFCVVK